MIPIEPGMKVAFQAPPEPTNEQIEFVVRIGAPYVVLWTDVPKASSDYYAGCKAKYHEAGIKVYGFGNVNVHNQPDITLGLEGQDAKIEEYKQHIRNLGKAGIPYTTYAHMANGIWSTERETVRGGAPARGFNLDTARAGHWYKTEYTLPLSHGRKYSEEEIWKHFEYFIRQVAPVAEEAGVRIGIHPDDPPVPELAGIPRCIFGSFEGYRRALEIADSPNVGVCLCVGCWLEGGELMGKSVEDTIKYFGAQNKLFKIHLRNITRPLPHFTETFLDDGYGDMYRVVKTLQEVDFQGVIIADHIPEMAEDRRVGAAWSVGYIKALVQSAESEA
ncbi:MAG: D-mannonate dehydratase [Spirochaetales bacterium]|nr:D-mannonate dehydratase [Spirochaetales bacterium]